MVYDFDSAPDRSPPKVPPVHFHANDLELIVTLLELAAIYLTPSPGTLFTQEQLFTQAQEIIGDLKLNERALKIVLESSSFLKKAPGKRYSLR